MPVGEVRANSTPVPRHAWMAGIVLSFALCGLVVVAFSKFDLAPVTTYLLPPLLVALAAFAFAAIWPGRPWFWGLLLSSGFWAYFLIAFIAYLSISQWEGSPLARSLMALLAGIGGAFAAAGMRTGRGSGRTPG